MIQGPGAARASDAPLGLVYLVTSERPSTKFYSPWGDRRAQANGLKPAIPFGGGEEIAGTSTRCHRRGNPCSGAQPCAFRHISPSDKDAWITMCVTGTSSSSIVKGL